MVFNKLIYVWNFMPKNEICQKKLKGERNINCKYTLEKSVNKPFILMQEFSKSV